MRSQHLAKTQALNADDIAWLETLADEWQLLADLALADLIIWFPETDEHWQGPQRQSYIALAQARPSTTQTLIHRDVVGERIRSDLGSMVERAWRSQLRTNSSDQGKPSPSRTRVSAMPLVRENRTIAVMTIHFSVLALRSPSRLELVYQRSADQLMGMAAEALWPRPGENSTSYAGAPRVGDGLLALNSSGTITFASPNAVSAFLGMGVDDALEGRQLTDIGAALRRRLGGAVDETEPLALTGRQSRQVELEAHGAVVSLRSQPLIRSGQHQGALVLCRDVTDLRRREKLLLSKDATIKEIHHRVKNNLQTVSALLRMQSRRMESGEGKDGLDRAQRRVETIAVVHDVLSQGIDEHVNVDELMRRQLHLAAEMAQSQQRAHTEFSGSFGTLPADMVTPLALVITELVANAVEHSGAEQTAQDQGEHQVCVRLDVRRRADAAQREHLDIDISDNGAGMPHEQWKPGLGLQIVRTLVTSELAGFIHWQKGTPQREDVAGNETSSIGETQPSWYVDPVEGKTSWEGTTVSIRVPIVGVAGL